MAPLLCQTPYCFASRILLACSTEVQRGTGPASAVALLTMDELYCRERKPCQHNATLAHLGNVVGSEFPGGVGGLNRAYYCSALSSGHMSTKTPGGYEPAEP